jgi:DNA invertase Pin-like site-specific DNA recombinase
MFSLQVLGAVAQLERALIAERTKAGQLVARKHGRVGGNPGLRARDPAAIRKVQNSRDKTWLDRVLAQLDTWLPLQQIAAQLEAMRERTPRGGTRWHRSSVQQLLAKAERLKGI